MKYDLIVRSVAEKDIWQVAWYYEQQVNGLGKEWIMCVDDAMSSIETNPNIFSKYYREYRRGLVRRFPYGIFYIVDENTVSVVRILDLRQSPNVLTESLK